MTKRLGYVENQEQRIREQTQTALRERGHHPAQQLNGREGSLHSPRRCAPPGSALAPPSGNHPGEDGRVGPFAEQVILAWSKKGGVTRGLSFPILRRAQVLSAEPGEGRGVTCGGSHDHAHSPPHRVEVQHLQQLKPGNRNQSQGHKPVQK